MGGDGASGARATGMEHQLLQAGLIDERVGHFLGQLTIEMEPLPRATVDDRRGLSTGQSPGVEVGSRDRDPPHRASVEVLRLGHHERIQAILET